MLISRTAGYHGTHGFGTALAGIPANRVGFDPEEETIQVQQDSLDAMSTAIDETGAERIAAVFVEPVIGAGGVIPPVEGYIEGVSKLCKRERHPVRGRLGDLRLRTARHVVRDRALGRRCRT